MSHHSITLREANQNFSRLMAAVEQGEVFAITRRGREVALVMPSQPMAMGGVGQAAKGNAEAELPGKNARIPAAIPLTEAALEERMQRLEALVDKLLSALSSPPHE